MPRTQLPTLSQAGVPSQRSLPSQMQEQDVEMDDSETEFLQELAQSFMKDFMQRASRSQTLNELLRTIPAPAHDRTKSILDKVMESFSRQGACKTLRDQWKDALSRGEYKDISELNCVKAPSVQVSRLANETDAEALSKLSFNDFVRTTKKAALEHMILIKEQEIANLRMLCDLEIVTGKIFKEWKLQLKSPGVTPEQLTVLESKECASRVANAALSIGTNMLSRAAILKQKKREKEQEARAKREPPVGGDKNLTALVNEAVKRKFQSNADKQKNGKKGSGKGPGRAGPPNQKNQNKIVKKKGPTKNGQKGTSTKKQQKKR